MPRDPLYEMCDVYAIICVGDGSIYIGATGCSFGARWSQHRREQRSYDLRHSCATLMLAQGVPLVVVRDTLGHTQISTTADIYGYVLPETHRKAVG